MEIKQQEQTGYHYFLNSDFYKNNMSKSEHTKGDFDPQDVRTTGITGDIYLVEIKSYNDPNHPRLSSKFKDYQIDLDKIVDLCDDAKDEGRIPLLYVKFDDCEVIWQPSKKECRKRCKQVWTNDKGYNYGDSKSLTWQTYFHVDEALWINYF